MSTVRAYYDGSAFVPIEPINITKGKVVNLSIIEEDSNNREKLEAFRNLTNEIHELNKEELIPAEFDEILSKRVNFSRELDL